MLKPYYISRDHGHSYTLQYLTFEDSNQHIRDGYIVIEPITKAEAAAYYKTKVYKRLFYCQKGGTPTNSPLFPIPHNNFYTFDRYVFLMELDERNKALSFFIKL